MTYFDRTEAERETIRRAYEFEVTATKRGDNYNPYMTAILEMTEGEAVWEALKEAVEMTLG